MITRIAGLLRQRPPEPPYVPGRHFTAAGGSLPGWPAIPTR
jgi:hypothetical protein